MDSLKIKTGIQIAKPASEVFEAIVNPEQMSNYFISHGSGRMEEGANLIWHFPEFDGDAPIHVGKVIKDELVSYYWDIGGREMHVEMNLEAKGNSTIVIVTEGTMPDDEEGIKWLAGNTEGWANFLACLKAWLEHKINLRKGAFDYRF